MTVSRDAGSGDDLTDDPENVAEEEFEDWTSKHGEAVRSVLGEMTSVYADDGEPIDVKFASASAAISRNLVVVNPHLPVEMDPPVKGPNILRLLDDLLAHEVEHVNASDLEVKKKFSDCYPGWGSVPGFVANVLEDEYVDTKRKQKFYGMRSKLAYYVWLHMNTEKRAPPVDQVEEDEGFTSALVTALFQTALAGYVKGIEDASDEIAEFCSYAEPLIQRVRGEDDPDQRLLLYHAMMQLLIRYAPDPDDVDDDMLEERRRESGGSGEPPPSPDADAPDVELPEELKEALEAMLEEMVEGHGFPIPTPREEVDSDEAGERDGERSGADGDETGDDLESEMDAHGSVASAEADDDETGGAAGDDTDDESVASEMGESDDGTDTTVGVDADGEDGGHPDEADESMVETELDSEESDVADEDESSETRPLDHDIDGGKTMHHIDPDRVEEFADRDEHELEERYDVRLDEIDKADERERARWANLVKQLSEYGTDVEQRKRDRDRRMTSRDFPARSSGDGLRQRAKSHDVISDLKDGFEQMVTRPTPRPSQVGTQMEMTNVVRHKAGDVTVDEFFEEEVVVETGDRCVGFCTDISGSMSSSIDELKIAGGAVAEATKIIGDDFVWEAFTDKGHGGLDLRIVTGPDETFEWDHLDSFTACANEPTAAGIRDCRMLMEQTSAREYVMIVVTDGMALVGEDGKYYGRTSNAPVEQARQAVRECRQDDIDVIGLGIGSMDDRKMRETFGDGNFRLTSIEDLAEDILQLYAEQMDVSRGGI